MKKQLLLLALAAGLVPAFNANAQTLEQVWLYQSSELNDGWDGTAPNWSSTDAIKAKACMRMGVGYQGKIYSVNMTTMAIDAIDGNGISQAYKLPALEGNDYYGTAISVDQVGNFLVGHYFTNAPLSSTVWTVYSPKTGEAKRFDLGVPDDVNSLVSGPVTTNNGIGRIDCVGRVLGDLTNNAVFFIAPQSTFAQTVRIVYAYGDGSVENVELDGTTFSPGLYLGAAHNQNVAQPKYTTFDEFYANEEHPEDGFYLSSCCGSGQWDRLYVSFNNGVSDNSFNTNMKKNIWARTNGFDTFVLDGKRYFVRNYITTTGASYDETEYANNPNTMNIAVLNENGGVVAIWKNPNYSSDAGYSSITAEPCDDGTANIYVYNSTSKLNGAAGGGAAAMLKFTPESSDKALGTVNNPYKISTSADLVKMGEYVFSGDFYVSLENDLDMTDVAYVVPKGDSQFDTKFHFDGKNHVISNLTVTDGNASLFGALSGEVKNLGIENVHVEKSWFCVGAIAGQASDATISNCYVTGLVRGAASGGLVGANPGKLLVENCYVQADVADEVGGHSGGLVGRADADLTINNAYASGPVAAKIAAGGIVATRLTPVITLNNVIAWNPSVTCDGVADAVCAGHEAIKNNVLVWSEMLVNEAAVEGGVSHEDLVATATSWSAFSKELIDGFPVLAWQNGETGGVAEIEIEEGGNAAPVYYNLQGVQVANPEGGIYIVRRGNKVTKEYIR